MSDRLDIVLFGATGFTGKYTIPEIYHLTQSNNRSLKWGIAGRSLKKLQNVLTNFGKVVGKFRYF